MGKNIDLTKTIKELESLIRENNVLYRIGKPAVPDSTYDEWVEDLLLIDPTNDIFNEIGINPDIEVMDESRKRDLPIVMASMNKVKTIEELKIWANQKGISQTEELVLTPKLDGISLCAEDKINKAYTRGNGYVGQKSDDHYVKFKKDDFSKSPFRFTYGEVMMDKKTFQENYQNRSGEIIEGFREFANPRNLVAGLFNRDTATDPLTHCTFIRYGAIPLPKFENVFTKKSEILSELNKYQFSKINFSVVTLDKINEELMDNLFKDWSSEFDIDGIIVEINSLEKQNLMGRERSTRNPSWARAYKSPKYEQSATVQVIGITWNISKQGLLKPIIHINPVVLDGVTVSNVTGNNARFVKDMGIGIGAIVKVKRSGMVIPIITEVIKPVEFLIPNVPNIKWNDRMIELVTTVETDDQKLKQIIAFFSIMDVDNVSEGVVKQLWDAGYTSIRDILILTKDDLMKIDRFGKRKSEIVYNSIRSKMENVELPKLQHATGIFNMLGSKKLALLSHFDTKPTLDQVMVIEGFAEKSAKVYLESYDRFFDFIKELPITIKKKEEKVKTQSLNSIFEGKSFVFTGFRSKEMESKIVEIGGKISSGISKSTSYLVVTELGGGSSKEIKALSLGVEIIEKNKLEELLK